MSDSDGEGEFQDAADTFQEPVETPVDESRSSEEIVDLPNFDPGKVFAGSKFEGLSICDDAIIGEVQKAMDLFLSNKFEEAKTLLEKHGSTSMYHALGYGTILAIRAVMTMEQADIQAAFAQLKTSVAISSRYRKRESLIASVGKMVKGGDRLANLTKEQIHAELAYAESTLLKADITFLAEEGIMGFVKGGLSLKNAYSTYKNCLKLIEKLEKEGALQSSGTINNHFVSGVYLGAGTFNLVFSLFPARLLKLFEIVGITTDKANALSLLDQGSNLNNALRAPLCDLLLLGFHVLGGMIEIPGGNLGRGNEILQKNLALYPNGAIFLFFDGKINQTKKLLRSSVDSYNQAIGAELVWRQLHHLCYWELCWNHALLLEWEKAAEFAAKLFEESKWSKSVYAYMQASFLFMTGKPEHQEKITSLMKAVPQFKQKIAGKSIPIEKFVIRKARQYLNQNNSLLLPGFEIAYMWSYLRLIGETLPEALGQVEQALEQVRAKPDSPTLADDVALCQILRGCLVREEGDVITAEEAFQGIVEGEKKLNLDHYLAPFARLELGRMFLQLERLEEAKVQLEAARSKYKNYSMESKLHFRVHILLADLEQQAGKK